MSKCTLDDKLYENNFYVYKSTKDQTKYLSSSLIGMTIGIAMFLLWIPYCILFFYNGNVIKICLLIIYFLQFFIKKNEIFFNFIVKLNVHKYFKSYTLIIEDKIENNNSLICIHPHGAMGVGGPLILLNEKLISLNFTYLVTNVLIYLPLSGVLVRLMGFQGCHNKHFKELMSAGNNVAFITGGYECAFLTDENKDNVYIKNRKGFIKYALEYGYRIHPTYIYNENKIFYIFQFLKKLRQFFIKIKIRGVFFIGNYIFYPRCDIDIITVIGSPIILPKIINPSTEDIEKYHKIYVESLINLYDKYKVYSYCKQKELNVY